MAKMAISAVARLNAEALARRWAEALYPDYAV
jgi:hypothetical protein